MTDSTAIRDLAYDDLSAVVDIERRCFRVPWTLGMFLLEFSKPSTVALVAHSSDGQIRGYVICSRYADAWHIMNLSVDRQHRRRGIASTLMSEMLERCGSDQQYTLEVRETNHSAIRLYEGLGFVALGKRKKYYKDNGEDALVMWRTQGTLAGRCDDVPDPEVLVAKRK